MSATGGPVPLSTRRKADRADMAEQVAQLARQYGLDAAVAPEEPGSRKTQVDIAGPHGLRLAVRFEGGKSYPDTYVLNWYGVADGTRLHPGLFGIVNVHGRKATDTAHGFPQLMRTLWERFEVIRNGSAFVTAARPSRFVAVPASEAAAASPLQAYRRGAVERFAGQLGIDPDALDRGTAAAWSHMGPQRTDWEQALSLAGSVLKASGTHAPPF